MAQKQRRECDLLLSPRKNGRFMDEDTLEQLLEQHDFMEFLRDEKMKGIEKKLENIEDRLDKKDSFLVVLKKEVNHNTATTNFLLDNQEQFQRKYLENVARTAIQIDRIRKLAQDQQNNRQQRLSHLEEGYGASGSDRNIPTESGAQRRKAPCPFCAKVLTKTYLREHQAKYCKQAKAAAATEGESSLVISDTRSLAGTELVSEEIPAGHRQSE